MLTFSTGRSHRDCDGSTRRDFLKAGTLGMGGLSLANLLAARSQAAETGRVVKDTSVVWLWLGGGPTHVETFDPKMSAPSEYRSTTGEELRTTTRNAAPMSAAGTVISRNATSSVTNRNRLTATLNTDSVARRLLRRAFLAMKVAMVMGGSKT